MLFLLDNSYIPSKKYNNNESYFQNKKIIPINSKFFLYLNPYYENNSYHFRNFFSEKDYKLLINNLYNKKQTSQKIYNKVNYYIPYLPKGKIINYEILPIKTKKFNIIDTPFIIKCINTYNYGLKKNLKKKLTINAKKKINANKFKSLSIDFIPIEINKSDKFLIIKWIPKLEVLIDLNCYFEIDISNFINKYTDKFHLICQFRS
jgi:hypothetical protein